MALAVALLRVVHPLQTQSVTYVVQRLEALDAVFYLACFYCLLRSRDSSGPAVWNALAMPAFMLGMGTKETMITAPFLV